MPVFRLLAVFIAAGALAGCATKAEREMTRLQTVSSDGERALDSCMSRVEATPAYASIKGKLALGRAATLAEQADTSKPTASEIQALYAYHEGIVPCRKSALETAASLSPALVPVLVEGFNGQDAVLVDLVSQRETWGGAVRRMKTVASQADAKATAVGSQVQRNLDQSHAAELQRRQAASAAIGQWVQNQQIINAMNQPRYTNCIYVGTQLSCVTQ